MISIIIAKEYTDAPGARFKKEGDYSGEEFREKLLEPRYLKAIAENIKLLVDLDGGYGYATSFLEEAFGGLARLYDKEKLLSTIVIKSDDEPSLIDDINEYIENGREKITKGI